MRVDRQAGFSLIEVIGALTIAGLLAVAVVPRMIKRTDLAVRAQEVANLAALSGGLLSQTTRSGMVTESTGWTTNAAAACAFSVSQAATNARLYNRVYFSQSSATNPSTLPFAQSSTGAGKPANLRVVILSLLGGPQLSAANCPSPSGGQLSDSDFNTLWNTPDGSKPTAGLWTNWSGSADDFLMQRFDYAPLFHHLILPNRDTNFTAAFTINGSSSISVTNPVGSSCSPCGAGWDAYYLDGTVVGLCNLNNSPITQTSYTLTRDIGFVFEEGLWRAQIMGLANNNTNVDNFSSKAASFLSAQWYTGAQMGADQQGVLVAMYSFMYTYTLWANECPHFPWHNASSSAQVPEYQILLDIGGTSKTANSGRLYEFTNGLLK